ncbi:hypothetical protein NDU88_003671 [Pleurodeles waltl]|uniref:Uncharacterized protein n=1 Tax=Pleurodeles waltl TaxID=8319 RepID=A0AAV7UED0_PLEWA|nr:hypothetical protein NDU88_003671 [Pleurodeles waltl]
MSAAVNCEQYSYFTVCTVSASSGRSRVSTTTPTSAAAWRLSRVTTDHLARPHVSMGTPADADAVNFRSPREKEKTDSDEEKREEFSLETPTEKDSRGTPKTERDDPQVL